MRKEVKEKTECFARKYLVKGDVRKGVGLYKMVKESAGIDHKAIAKEIRNMPYEEYLYSLYWQLVSVQVKHDAGCRCASCGRKGNLVVHHPSYRYLGYDMYHLADLQCLCRKCHEEIHGIVSSRVCARTK